jgi:peptidoglycan DL-endopeptidase CwlO
MMRTGLVAIVLATLACATPRALAPGAPNGAVPARYDLGSRVEVVLDGARATLGASHPRLDGSPVPTDCSGYLHALYRRAGLDVFSESRPGDNGVRAIARFVEKHGRFFRAQVAAPGDLVFFDNSYDRDGDGKFDDWMTHAGVVEQVLPDGTMWIIHATNHGIVREPMNLLRPHEAMDASGRMINASLRRRSPHDAPYTPHLMAELFAGFGSVFGREPIARTGE